jgi:ribosomal protein S18 acetylase RimI-like enzyme
MFGAFNAGRLVGLTGLGRETARKLAHKAYVWGVYVAPPLRQRGLGRRLMTAALKRAAAMPGVLQVNLGVHAGNTAAIALYEAMGFMRFGLERGYLMWGGVLHDELHMACRINETSEPSATPQ